MKGISKLLIASIIFSLLLSGSALGDERSRGSSWDNHEVSKLLDRSIKLSKDIINRYGRGEILSEGSVEIVNEQNGDIYIGMHTLAHKNVDFIQHTYFLDQWDESEQDWIQIDSMKFTRTKEEEADGTLSYLMTSDTISGYPVNRYYRVRGMHLVELNGDIEMCSTQTHGVLITKN